jgi:hypothetical protein
MKVELQDGNLIFTLPLESPTPSASGKTHVVASSRGVQKSELEIDGRPMHWNLNAFVYQVPRKKHPRQNDLNGGKKRKLKN